MMTKIKTAVEIESMRQGGRMLATVLDDLKKQIKAGMTTYDLDHLAHKRVIELGGEPAFLGYYGFPSTLCTSINDEVVHGLPSKKRLIANGDIVSMDFGVLYQGMITDAALSVVVGTTNNIKLNKFLHTTEEAMWAGIQELHNNVPVGNIAAAIQKVLEKQHYGIVRDLVGHGVGHKLHEDPNIPNFGKAGKGPVLKAGMTIAIEPMATLGDHRVYCHNDSWTVKTLDSSLSAHFEHTVLITEDGYEVLTAL